MGTKVLIIGLDGATPELVDRWVKEEKLPYLKKVMQNSAYGKLKSTYPPISRRPGQRLLRATILVSTVPMTFATMIPSVIVALLILLLTPNLRDPGTGDSLFWKPIVARNSIMVSV